MFFSYHSAYGPWIFLVGLWFFLYSRRNIIKRTQLVVVWDFIQLPRVEYMINPVRVTLLGW